MFGPIDRNVQPPLEGHRSNDVVADGMAGDLKSNSTLAPTDEQEGFWLTRARDAYASGKNWFDVSVRKQIETNLAHFRNQHAPGSKYYSEVYRKKSNAFRPRTRSMVRRTEAATAIAFFATSDLVNVSAANEAIPDQVDAAEVHNQLLNYRLENTIPWFQTVIGGAQDAANTGVVISKQDWEYQTRRTPMLDLYEHDVTGELTYEESFDEKVVVDRPRISLIPIENLLLDPAANWIDPINSSPYLIELVPMYVHEVRERMKRINPRTGMPEYKEIEGNLLSAAIHQDWDSIRKAREGNRTDKYEADSYVNEYETVWIHRNIMRVDGIDWTYDTLGTEMLLSEPEPLEDVYPHLAGRERPYKMGTTMMEAHKLYPMAPTELVMSMQQEINDLANLRTDNVKLSLNKRYFVKRGAGVDVTTLIRNIPGSAVYMDQVSDVKETQPQDVTASSYQEQDRLNMEFDEVSGSFSSASVGTNRRLNETVGGMSMLSADASQVKEYEIRTLTETWVEGVLRQLVLLEAWYETDDEVLGLVAAKADMPTERVLEVLHKPVRTRVNVGFSSTAPERRIGKIMSALDGVAKLAPQLMMGLDTKELLKELFGAVGYRDGSRFFSKDEEDPQVAALKQQVAQLQQIIDSKQVETQGKVQVAQVTGEYRLAAVNLQAGVAAELGRINAAIEAKKVALQQVDLQLAAAQGERDRQELMMQREALSHEIQDSNRQFLLKLRELSSMKKPGAKPAKPEAKALPAPGTGTPSEGAYNLPGEDKAGVISRDRYGLIPFAAG